MRKRILALLLLVLLLLPQTVHADVIFFSPSSLHDRRIRESSILLDVEEREFIALTDLTGWEHPHRPTKQCAHEKGSALYISRLYTDPYGRTWAHHKRYDGPSCGCWVAYSGLAPASADPLPAAPDALPVPRPTSLTCFLMAGGMILIVLLATLAILRAMKRKTQAA